MAAPAAAEPPQPSADMGWGSTAPAEQFTYNTGLKIWALHVWAWRDNPAGLYAN